VVNCLSNRTSYDVLRMAEAPQQHRAWFTRRRLRVHGLILALCLWCTYAWVLATPGLRDRNGNVKGTDFLHFYTLGTLASEHRGDALYDMQAQAEISQQRVPGVGRVLFVPLYPPQVSLLFVPFAALPYSWALLCWVSFSAVLYGLCCRLIWKTCGHLQRDGWLVLLLALAYPAFFHVIVWGQSSVLALACFTLAYLALRSGRPFAAGLAIGCLIFKPQLGLAAAFLFVLSGEWRIVTGALVSSTLQLLVGWMYYGTAVLRDYWQHLTHVSAVMNQFEPRPYQMHSLRAFWTMLLPWPRLAFTLSIASALAVLFVALLCWRRGGSLGVRFSVLLVATVLVSPHLTVYDLMLLAPMFLLLGDAASAEDALGKKEGLLLYLCFVLPLIGPLSIWTHVQLSVPAMVALLWVIYRKPKSTGEDPSTGSGQAGRRSTEATKFPVLHGGQA